MEGRHLLSFLLLCTTSALSQSLVEVLQDSGFTDYAELLQGDPILYASSGLIVYAPTNAALAISGIDLVARQSGARTNNRALNSFSCVNATAPRSIDPYDYIQDSPGNITRLFKNQVSSSGSIYGTLLDDPEWVNLGAGHNQTLVEKRLSPASLPLVFTGLGTSVKVTASDIPFDGGIIRPIDGVLTLPRNLSYTLPFLGAGSFGAGLEKAGLLEDLDNRAAITVLAPDDAAFRNISTYTDAELAQVLAGHVVLNFPAYTPMLKDGHTYPTLGGGNVTVSVREGTAYINGARILAGDAIIKNGVVHTIDKILTTLSPVPSSVPIAVATMAKPLPWHSLLFTFVAVAITGRQRFL